MSVSIKVVSKSSGKEYEITQGHDGVVYCTCPAWKFQKGKSAEERTCKHMKQVAAELFIKAES